MQAFSLNIIAFEVLKLKFFLLCYIWFSCYAFYPHFFQLKQKSFKFMIQNVVFCHVKFLSIQVQVNPKLLTKCISKLGFIIKVKPTQNKLKIFKNAQYNGRRYEILSFCLMFSNLISK